MTGQADIKHGTITAWIVHHCRCQDCQAGNDERRAALLMLHPELAVLALPGARLIAGAVESA